MDVLKYGNREVNFDTLPAASQYALARRGLAHFLGNEQASKVTSHFDGEEPTDEAKAAFKNECVTAALAALATGTVGVSGPRGPRVSPVESIIRELAVRKMKDICAKNKLALPTGDKVLELNGVGYTREQLIERQIAKHPEFKAEAERELRARERKAAQAGEVSDL